MVCQEQINVNRWNEIFQICKGGKIVLKALELEIKYSNDGWNNMISSLMNMSRFDNCYDFLQFFFNHGLLYVETMWVSFLWLCIVVGRCHYTFLEPFFQLLAKLNTT